MVLSSNPHPARINRLLIAACGTLNCILAALCVHFYVAGHDSISLIAPIQRAIWRVTNPPGAAKDILANKAVSVCSTFKFKKNAYFSCYGNTEMWAAHEGEIIHSVLHDLKLLDDSGTRILCQDLHTIDPPLVTVQQAECYPKGYFNDVPAAKPLKPGYPGTTSIQSPLAMPFFCSEHFLFTTYLGAFLPKNRPAVVVDAGANIGLATILFSQVINFNGEVLSIEANPSTLEVLTKNVEVLGDQVKVVPAALVTEDVARRGETVNFAAASEDDYWAFRVIPDSEVTEKMEVHKVPTYSLSDIKSMSIYGTIDFLKLDIEGQEKYIFEDEKSWPVLCGVRCMAAEVHEKLAPGATRALEDFISEACKGDQFQHITTTGEYSLWCRPSVLSE